MSRRQLNANKVLLWLAIPLLGWLGYQLVLVANISTDQSIEAWDCGNCHAKADNITQADARLLVAPEETLCTVCHTDALIASHPSGVTPSMDFPDDFTLSLQGRLTCSSCHLVHDDKHGRLALETTQKEFCLSCHDRTFFEAMADGGAAVMDHGHLKIEPAFEVEDLDRFSAECLLCHADEGPDAVATPQVIMGINGVVTHEGSRVNHPVGVDYRETAAIALSGYVALENIADTVLLPEGRLSCLSCHVGYSQNHGEIVSTQNNRELCFECHDL